ncbi:MAG: NAD(P)H-binding protein [Mesorhizobium sp.]
MRGSSKPTIAILGASGLIGQAVATHLIDEGFSVVAIARTFTPAQRELFGDRAKQSPIVALDDRSLSALLQENAATIVVNCIGMLQDSTLRGATEDAHSGFVKRLVTSIANSGKPSLLVHVSIPGRAEDDRTSFSTTKREAESIIAASGLPYVILRPGFVVAPAAFGGSALIRALAALPFGLPQAIASRPFAATDVDDIGRTVSAIATRWTSGDRDWRATWDVMERRGGTVGEVIQSFRRHFGGLVACDSAACVAVGYRHQAWGCGFASGLATAYTQYRLCRIAAGC